MDEKVCGNCGRTLIPELTHCPHCGEEADLPSSAEVRCECGFLNCKLTETAIEIKCRRCRRMVYIPVAELPERFEKLKKRRLALGQRQSSSPPGGGGNYKRQFCTVCGQYKHNILSGKCLDCRTESIKVQYKSRQR